MYLVCQYKANWMKNYIDVTFLLYFKRFDIKKELGKNKKKLNLKETTQTKIMVSLSVYSTENK